MGRRFGWVAAFALVVGFLIPRLAVAAPRGAPKGAPKAATITVDTSADEENNDGNCSLREAVDAANSDSAVDNCAAGSGTDTILFSSTTNNHPIDLTLGSLDVTTDMTIDGNGVGTTTITGDEIDTSGPAETIKDMTLVLVSNEPGTVTIDNIKATDEMNNNSTGAETTTMTISNSTLVDVTNNSGFGTSKTVMTITDSTTGFIDSNSGFGTSNTSLTLDGVTASGVGNNSGGGSTTTGDISNSDIGSDGIAASGSDSSTTVTVADTSVTGTGSNDGIDVEDATVTVTGTTITGFDEGIFSDGPTTTLTNSTVTGLSSEGLAVGGGTFNVTNSTITNGQTGIDSFGGTITITNTIVAGFSEEGDCSGTVKSGGGNIADDGTCNLNGTGDQENTDPKLGPLQDNGGPTKTQLPQTGSPAIDKGLNGPCPSTDQREDSRPQDGDGDGNAVCDVGSVEVVPSGPEADVSVNKTDSPDPVLVGNDLTYTITVTNNGPVDAESVSMVDTLPSEVTFKSVSTTGGACSEDGGTVTCDLDTVNNGVTVTVTIVVTTNSVGTIMNGATATSQTPDPNISNNTDSTTTTVNPIPSGGVGTGAGGAAGGGTALPLLVGLGFLVAVAGLALRRARRA